MQTINDVLSSVAIGALGGLTNYLWGIQSGKKFSWAMFLINFFTSGFVGVLVFWLCDGLHLDPSICSFGAGVGGLLGTRAVDIIETVVRKRLGVENDRSRNQEQ